MIHFLILLFFVWAAFTYGWRFWKWVAVTALMVFAFYIWGMGAVVLFTESKRYPPIDDGPLSDYGGRHCD
jgi:hypothetical protein